MTDLDLLTKIRTDMIRKLDALIHAPTLDGYVLQWKSHGGCYSKESAYAGAVFGAVRFDDAADALRAADRIANGVGEHPRVVLQSDAVQRQIDDMKAAIAVIEEQASKA